MPENSLSIVRVSPFFQQYEWGKQGDVSLVAELGQHQGRNINKSQPYAELWLGIHSHGVCCIPELSINIGTFAQTYPSFVGNNSSLPYLMKILSVAKPLSLQVHPDRELAAELHKTDPIVFSDSNHKPEMTVALSTFEAFCGFHPLPQIITFIKAFPEIMPLFGTIINTVVSVSSSSNLKSELFESMMRSEDSLLHDCLSKLLDRLHREGKRWTDGALNSQQLKSMTGTIDIVELLIERLSQHFPYDVGVLCPLFLVYHILEPGEALFIDTNCLHSYILGDCLECMACSDNVIRGGLTHKHKDVDLLLQVLRFSQSMRGNKCVLPSNVILEGGLLTSYEPPVTDFSLIRITVTPGKHVTVPILSNASVTSLICVRGSGRVVCAKSQLTIWTGSCVMIAAGQGSCIHCESSEELEVSVCFTPDAHFNDAM
eukprot:GHVL01041320.1.p1 GENE.GHVL01041320.1~~GHVL01041320.1.p1  ORF type:complete len:429 (-),score=39.09 GHVL01041320.1:2454-3740(-)